MRGRQCGRLVFWREQGTDLWSGFIRSGRSADTVILGSPRDVGRGTAAVNSRCFRAFSVWASCHNPGTIHDPVCVSATPPRLLLTPPCLLLTSWGKRALNAGKGNHSFSTTEQPASLPACLSAALPACLPRCLPVCLSVCLSTYLPMSMCLSVLATQKHLIRLYC